MKIQKCKTKDKKSMALKNHERNTDMRANNTKRQRVACPASAGYVYDGRLKNVAAQCTTANDRKHAASVASGAYK